MVDWLQELSRKGRATVKLIHTLQFCPSERLIFPDRGAWFVGSSAKDTYLGLLAVVCEFGLMWVVWLVSKKIQTGWGSAAEFKPSLEQG